MVQCLTWLQKQKYVDSTPQKLHALSYALHQLSPISGLVFINQQTPLTLKLAVLISILLNIWYGSQMTLS